MSFARRLGPVLLAALVAITSLGFDAAHPAGAVVRSSVVDDAGAVVKLVIPAGEPGAGTYVPTWNGHGDALALWRLSDDGSGALSLANSYTYSTWGAPSTATHNGSPDLGFRFLYVGEFDVQTDDFGFGLGLLYMHARSYSPALGRFLQPDPDRSEANLYAYAANSPVTELDPSGTCFIILCIAVGIVLFGGLGAATGAAQYTVQTTVAGEDWSAGAAAESAAWGALDGATLAVPVPAGRVAGAIGRILAKVPQAARAARAASQAARAVPNPWGRLGSPAHQAPLLEAEGRLGANGWTTTSGGTSLKEQAVPIPGGGVRYPDLTMTRGGQRIAIQSGRTTSRGLPVARERAALRDLRASGRFNHVFFLRYQ